MQENNNKDMKKNGQIFRLATQVIDNEIDAIVNLKPNIDENFLAAVDILLENKGMAVFTGIGKSAIIAQKIVATMNSTGTPSTFMHAADAIHGDLGIIRPEDVIVVMSKSGETPEIKVLVPLLRLRNNKLIAIVGNKNSFLAQQADVVIDVTVSGEAIPGNLAPSCSTTAQLVMGDALALTIMKCKGFSLEDFAKFHPGGALGKQLYLRVKDLYTRNECPMVAPDDNMAQVIIEMTKKRLGATAVVDNGKLVGIVTDGDLRRMLMKHLSVDNVKAGEVMTHNPKTIDENAFLAEALQVMRQNSITQLPVMKEGAYNGVIHLHDILKEGVF